MAQQDAADARSSADAADTQVAESGRTDALVLEAMLLRHVRQVEARSGGPEGGARARRSPLRSRSLARSRAPRGGVPVGRDRPGGDRETYRSPARVLRSQVDAVGEDAAAGSGVFGAFLPRGLAIRLFRALQQQLPLARQLHILVERLLGALEDPAITVRAAAVRALSAVVDADPRVLEWEQVRAAVQRRMSDNGTMGTAVIDLLGKHVARDARRGDVLRRHRRAHLRRGRERAQARDTHPARLHPQFERVDFKHGVEALRFLAFRILDDDVGIQELVTRIFRELWFSRPAVPARRAGAEAADPVAERAEQLVAVLWEVYCGVSRVGHAKLPLLSTFPIVAILRRVVFPCRTRTPPPTRRTLPLPRRCPRLADSAARSWTGCSRRRRRRRTRRTRRTRNPTRACPLFRERCGTRWGCTCSARRTRGCASPRATPSLSPPRCIRTSSAPRTRAPTRCSCSAASPWWTPW